MISLRVLTPTLILPFLLFGIYYSIGIPKNSLFLITNLIILIFSYFGMCIQPLKFYTLSKVAFVFFFIFFGFVPLLHQESIINIYGSELNISDKIKANFIIIMGMFFFTLGNFIKINFFNKIINSLPEVKKLNFFYLLIFIFVCFVILLKWNFDLSILLTRSMFSQYIFDLSGDTTVAPKLEYHLFTKFIRPMPIILLFIFVYFYKNEKKKYNYKKNVNNLILLYLFTLCSVLLVFPTGIDRLQAAIFYIPFIIIFTNFWNKPYVMQATLTFGVFTVFEFLNKFRYYKTRGFEFDISFDFLKAGHFDAYENFVRAIELDFITYGYQLLGAILFFVPRSIWNEKPIGSGSVLAEKLNYDFGGISMPLIGEGYINFGIFGSLLFMLVFGILLGNLDRVAWEIKKLNKDCLFLYFYYLLFGLVFYTMRGDLMNSLAFIVTLTLSFWLIVIILKYLGKLKLYE